MSDSGKLIIVPTPIGNLGDVTVRVREALERADVVCAEDTRVTGKLLKALGISKRVERLDEAVMGNRAASVIGRVASGETIAYCSDAGMPGVSDPGLRLVAAARKAGVPVEVLPGPTAASTAYVASGTTNPHFYFGAFLPKKSGELLLTLEAVKPLDAALVFYESPNRLVNALGAIAEVFPMRYVAVCRELTKLHEEIFRGNSKEVHNEFSRRAKSGSIKGEIVIVIDGPTQDEAEADQSRAENSAKARAEQLRAEGSMSRKDIAKALQEEFGISRNAAYEMAAES